MADAKSSSFSVHRCTAESHLRDRILDEVEKDNLFTLPDKGGHSRLLPWKTVCMPSPLLHKALMKSFITILPKGEFADKIRQGCAVLSHSVMSDFATPWTVACQAPLCMEFSRQEYWSGLPFPSPGIFLTQGLNPGLLHWRQILYHQSHKGSPLISYVTPQRQAIKKLRAVNIRKNCEILWEIRSLAFFSF